MDFRQLLFVAGTLGLVAFVCFNAFVGAELLRRAPIRENLLLHPAETAARFVFIAACLGLGWLSGRSPQQLGLTLHDLPAEVLLGVGVGIALHGANRWATGWAVGRFGRGVYSTRFLRAIVPNKTAEWPLVVIALLPAALAEEMLFRSLSIGGLSSTAPPVVLAVGFAAIFGVAHLPQGRLGVVGAGVLGFALGVLFLWRWNVLACTVAHYTVNLLQLLQAKEELRLYGED